MSPSEHFTQKRNSVHARTRTRAAAQQGGKEEMVPQDPTRGPLGSEAAASGP